MALTYAQITAITEKHFIPKLVDGVYNSAAFTARLARPDKIKLLDGGTSIMAPVISSAPGEGGYFTDLDALSKTRTDDMTSSEHQWRQLFEPIRISRLELLKNSGDAAKLDLVKSKVQIAQKQMKDNLATGIFSAGGSNQIDGLQDIVDAANGTYGGIAPADFAEWVSVSKANGGTDRALTLNLMQNTFGALTEDDDRPTVAVCTQAVYDQAWSLFQPHQRLVSEEMGKLGFPNTLAFNGIPVLVDSHCKANAMYFLNEEYLYLAVHKDENMRRETIDKLEDSNSMLMRIFWAGNLVCNNRRFQGELDDIEVAS